MALVDGLVMWLHLLSAAIWVGGSIFLGAVLVPVLKTTTKSTEELVKLMIKVGRRFNKIAIPSLGILIVTGLYNSRPFLENPQAMFQTTYGIILLAKIVLVIATMVAYAVHVRLLNKDTEEKLMTGSGGGLYVQSLRSRIMNLGRIVVFLSIAILLLAAMLARGGF
jgi:putative copper resistance protein D